MDDAPSIIVSGKEPYYLHCPEEVLPILRAEDLEAVRQHLFGKIFPRESFLGENRMKVFLCSLSPFQRRISKSPEAVMVLKIFDIT